MNVGDTVYCETPAPKKNKPPLTSRCKILEINNQTAKLSCYDGKRIFEHREMLRNLRDKP